MLLNSILIAAALLSSEPADSLSGAIVLADRGAVVSRCDTLSVSSGSVGSLANALPGLLLSDYGGLSGGKTISLRGLGAAHTAIYVDGLRVSNLQSGQCDLGLLDLDGYNRALVDYAQNSVSFQSVAPSLTRAVGGRVSFEGGSFGTYIPRLSLDWRLSRRVSMRASVAAAWSKGNFPINDTLRRSNNDIRLVRGGLDFFGTLPRGEWRAKAYINSSDRGTPGSIAWPSSDRQRDLMSFVQGTFRRNISELYSLSLAAKGSWDRILFKSSWGDSDYHQSEYQLHTIHKFNIASWLSCSLVAGVDFVSLKSTNYNASRWAPELSAAASVRLRRFSANLELAYNAYFDVSKSARHYFTPSIDLSYTPFEGFKLSGFARRAPRVPNFNELYYVGYGNPSLKAEDAFLSDIGVEYRLSRGFWNFGAKADGFLNLLKDKISSAPTAEDPNIWLPFNIGKVRSAGLDVAVDWGFKKGEAEVHLLSRYCFQDAVDVTHSKGIAEEVVRHQIPYVPRHSLYLCAEGSYKLFKAQLRWNLRASRWDASGELPSWNTLDLTLSKEFRFKRLGALRLKVDLENLCSERYVLVRDYPMQTFSARGGVEVRF